MADFSHIYVDGLLALQVVPGLLVYPLHLGKAHVLKPAAEPGRALLKIAEAADELAARRVQQLLAV